MYFLGEKTEIPTKGQRWLEKWVINPRWIDGCVEWKSHLFVLTCRSTFKYVGRAFNGIIDPVM
jgi:hypothetical protein